jgi:hypothetical protein
MTRQAIRELFAKLQHYRLQYPGTPIFSVEKAAVAPFGNAKTLVLLSFFDDVNHVGPIAWDAPILATTLYSHAFTRKTEILRDHKMLVVDFRTDDAPSELRPGYYPLAEVAIPGGWLVVHAPIRKDSAEYDKATDH